MLTSSMLTTTPVHGVVSGVGSLFASHSLMWLHCLALQGLDLASPTATPSCIAFLRVKTLHDPKCFAIVTVDIGRERQSLNFRDGTER